MVKDGANQFGENGGRGYHLFLLKRDREINITEKARARAQDERRSV